MFRKCCHDVNLNVPVQKQFLKNIFCIFVKTYIVLFIPLLFLNLSYYILVTVFLKYFF